MKIIFSLPFIFSFFSFFIPGSVTAQVGQKDIDAFLNDSAVRTGHAGISIYEPVTGKYLYNYNADKNFIPSSNVKLFTLYAGMKYLGDSLVGLRFAEDDSNIFIVPTGDPTLLHPEFQSQRVFEFLASSSKKILYERVTFDSHRYGKGWAWDDYMEDYMPERSAFPIYGNVNTFIFKRSVPRIIVGKVPEDSVTLHEMYHHFGFNNSAGRNLYSNNFYVSTRGFKQFDTVKVPFITSVDLSYLLLADTLHTEHRYNDYRSQLYKSQKQIIYSRPVDSLFKPMMFISDNFFAEQTLMMVSERLKGYMSDKDVIDTLLKKDLKDIPTKPRWVDGSGLSRYNLFSPKAFIYILDKLQKDFGMDRMKRILPTGGQGTLTNYYDKEAGYIYAKTGSMSNNVALSGYLFTRKNKMFFFSILVNNYTGSGREGRRAIEKFIQRVRETN